LIGLLPADGGRNFVRTLGQQLPVGLDPLGLLNSHCHGLTENAGHENDGPNRLYVGHKSAQPENAGHENAGHDIAGHLRY